LPTGLEALLRASVVGQDEAIRMVVDALELRSAGLDLRANRPLSFLLCGPTGVGKTELALALTRTLYGGPERLLRIDCSEYAEAHQVARLVGAPPSYVGYGAASPLEEFLKPAGEGVLLLDEFEKAHPALHRLFLQALDAGRLTNAAGRTLDLSGLAIVATTNAGLRRSKGYGYATPGESGSCGTGLLSTADLCSVFSPELLNRFDAVIAFRALGREAAREILQRHLIPAACARVLERHGVELTIAPAVEEAVLEKGFSVAFGVRHLQRAFATLILQPVARAIGRGVSRGQRLVLVMERERIAVHRESLLSKLAV
jgi:ATP-dependent Clp protease ATP-binding subunit ClpA